MSQTRGMSFVESWANIFIGFTLNITANLIILPLIGFKTFTLKKGFFIGIIFTFIALVRSYCIRRFFNKRGEK